MQLDVGDHHGAEIDRETRARTWQTSTTAAPTVEQAAQVFARQHPEVIEALEVLSMVSSVEYARAMRALHPSLRQREPKSAP